MYFSLPHYSLLLALRKVIVPRSWEGALADTLRKSHKGGEVRKNDTQLEKPLFISLLQLTIPALFLGFLWGLVSPLPPSSLAQMIPERPL